MSPPPGPVLRRVERFAVGQRRAVPGLVSSILLTGSAVAGDWIDGTSDIDAVFVLTRTPRPEEVAVLAGLHAASRDGHVIDGIYLTEDQLASGPDRIRAAVQVVEGRLFPAREGGQISWVTWREIEGAAEAVVEDVPFEWRPSSRAFDGAGTDVREACRRNLESYWNPLGRAQTARLQGRGSGEPVSSEALQWLAFGPARLIVTIGTGVIVSKTAAGRYAADRWPEHAGVLGRAIAARQGSPERFTVADAHEVVQLLGQCADAARGDGPS